MTKVFEKELNRLAQTDEAFNRFLDQAAMQAWTSAEISGEEKENQQDSINAEKENQQDSVKPVMSFPFCQYIVFALALKSVTKDVLFTIFPLANGNFGSTSFSKYRIQSTSRFNGLPPDERAALRKDFKELRKCEALKEHTYFCRVCYQQLESNGLRYSRTSVRVWWPKEKPSKKRSAVKLDSRHVFLMDVKKAHAAYLEKVNVLLRYGTDVSRATFDMVNKIVFSNPLGQPLRVRNKPHIHSNNI